MRAAGPLIAAGASGGARVLWDVVGEHLDDAEHYWEQLDRALDSARYTLDEVVAGPERALLSNLDGMVVGGPAVVERLLERELEAALVAPEPYVAGRVGAIVLALLLAGRRHQVAETLGHPSSSAREAAARACARVSTVGIDDWVLQSATRRKVSGVGGRRQRASFLSIVVARGLPPPGLSALLESDDSDELVAALTAARRVDPTLHLARVEALLAHAEVRVRDAALVTALHAGSRPAWARCRDLALDDDEPSVLAMQLVASLGGPDVHRLLAARLERDSHRRAVLRALGLTGNIAMVPTLLATLESVDPEAVEARLAAEAIATITGAGLDVSSRPEPSPVWSGGELPPPELDEEARRSLPPLEDDELDADLRPAPEEELPVPDAQALARWWQQVAADFDPCTRFLAGRRAGPEVFCAAAVEALIAFPTRRRHGVAMALSVRTGGVGHIDCWALATTQKARLQTLRVNAVPRVLPQFGYW